MSQLPFDWKPTAGRDDRPAISVTDLTRQISAALERGLADPIRVEGEVAAFSERRGHWYFALRDDEASIQCVMWASDVRRGSATIAIGDAVQVDGTLVHWAAQGRTQLRVRSVAPVGAGGRQAAFRRLCAELRDLGWFGDEAKRPLPVVPRHVAVLTSGAGAALHDVRATAARRWPACRIELVDVPVQGDSAAARIAAVLTDLDARAGELGVDAIVLTRGGGSAEDLQAFNERVVAEAIHKARTPIVAAIGHESDTTIAELVADCRASTPTQAIMVLLPDREEETQRLDLLQDALARRVRGLVSAAVERGERGSQTLMSSMRLRLAAAGQRLAGAAGAMLARRPHALLATRRNRVIEQAGRLDQSLMRRMTMASNALSTLPLDRAIRQQMDRAEARLRQRQRVLEAVGPESVLARGFSLTTTASGEVVRSSSDVQAGDEIETRVASGTITSTVAGE